MGFLGNPTMDSKLRFLTHAQTGNSLLEAHDCHELVDGIDHATDMSKPIAFTADSLAGCT